MKKSRSTGKSNFTKWVEGLEFKRPPAKPSVPAAEPKETIRVKMTLAEWIKTRKPVHSVS